MIDQAIITEIAKLDGWKRWPFVGWTPPGTRPPFTIGSYPPLPDYLNSLDAIIPVIKKQDKWTKEKIDHELMRMQLLWRYLASPREFCTALLRVTGKLK